MIILSEPGDKLQVRLNNYETEKALDCFCTWRDNYLEPKVILNVFVPNRTITITEGATPIDLVVAPLAELKRTIDFISIINTNNRAHIVIITFVTATTETILYSSSLAVGERLQYTDMTGFITYDVNGAMKYKVV